VVGKEVTLVASEVHRVHDRWLRPTIFCSSIRIRSNVMWSIVEPTCWARWYISQAVSYYQDRMDC
jgi:hypothetical protein